MKIIYRDYDSTYGELLANSNSSTLLIARLRLMICEVFKCINKENPPCINNLIEIKDTHYSFRNALKIHQPKKKSTTHGLRSFAYTGAKLWNEQSIIVDISTKSPSFKIFLKDLHLKLDPNFNYV